MDLKPCPICRSARIKLQEGDDWVYAECLDCGTDGPVDEDPDKAKALWNTRAPDPELATLRAQLAEAQEALVAHNDHLRSAFAVASRNGQSTGWPAFTRAIDRTLKDYHEDVKRARAALSAARGDA